MFALEPAGDARLGHNLRAERGKERSEFYAVHHCFIHDFTGAIFALNLAEGCGRVQLQSIYFQRANGSPAKLPNVSKQRLAFWPD